MAEYLCEEDMNTGEYISRDEALKAMQYCCENCDNYNGAMCRACDNADEMDIICDIPAADVQPVKRGYWYDVGAEYIKEIGQFKIHAFCSKCHRLNYHLSDYSQNMEAEFCQHCGADMRSPEAIKG